MWVTKNQLFIVLFCAHWPTVALAVVVWWEGVNGSGIGMVWYVECVYASFGTMGRVPINGRSHSKHSIAASVVPKALSACSSVSASGESVQFGRQRVWCLIALFCFSILPRTVVRVTVPRSRGGS